MQCPSIEDLQEAHKVFLEHEPRDLFYQVATELIELAINKEKTKVTLSAALAVLLQTWNRAYYQFNHFDEEHFDKIDQLVEEYAKEIISNFRTNTILSLPEKDKDEICKIFVAFEEVLGPVGAAKSLHLLAPRFFPLWDRTIAKEGYGIPMGPKGKNADRYYKFMEASYKCYKILYEKLPSEHNPLKWIDEYNYCHYTKHWI